MDFQGLQGDGVKKAFFLLMVFSLLFAQNVCDPTTGMDNFWWDVLMVLVGIAALLIAIVYIIGSAFHFPNFIVLAKEELSHLIITVLMLLLIQGIFIGSCTIFSSYLSAYAGIHNPIEYSKNFFSKMQNELQNTIGTLYSDYFDYRILSSVYAGRYDFSGSGVVLYTNYWREIVASQIEILINLLSMLLLSAKMQGIMFELALDVIVPWSVPFAVMARLVPQAREAGNILLGIIFSFYILLPFSYSVFAVSYDSISIPCNSAVASDPFFGGCEANGFIAFAKFFPYTILFPNIALAITISSIDAIRRALSFGGVQ